MSYVNISNNAFPFLDTLKYQFPELSALISEIQGELNLRLWHQLSGHLIELSEKTILHKGDYLIELYENVVKSIETIFNPMKIMLILKNVKYNFNHKLDLAIVFLDDINKRLNLQGEELIFMECIKADCQLGLNKFYEADALLKEIKHSLEKYFDVDHLIYSYFYKLYAQYYEKKQNYDEFYNYAIQYFAYCKEESLSKEEKLSMSYKMALASLVGEKMYNFTELIDKDFFKVLIGSDYEWIFNIIISLNSGKVDHFTTVLLNYSTYIQNEPLLNSKLNLLNQKVRITALLDMVFQKNKNERVFSYREVMYNCSCDSNQVEILSMKALSLGLIRGYIDEIEQQLVVSWIQPKFLDREKISLLSDRLDSWIKKSNEVLNEFERVSRPLLK